MVFKKKKSAKQKESSAMSEKQIRNFIGQIPQEAQQHRNLAKNLFGIKLDYSADSIPKLDEMIKEGWPEGPPVMLDEVVIGFGCYLGEAVRRLHGGYWAFSPELGFHIGLVGGRDIKICPFAKVKKRFVNGEEDSIGYFYSYIRSKIEEAKNPEDRGLPPVPIPKIVPGYLDDLLSRFASEEELPIPKGQSRSSAYTVSFRAHREAELIKDVTIVPQIAERLENLTLPDNPDHVVFVLASVIKNTRSVAAEKLLAKLLLKLPAKQKILEPVFWSLNRCPTKEVRAFAKKHIPHKSWGIEGSAFQVLEAGGQAEDFKFLSTFILGDKLHDSNYSWCVLAVVATGGKRALPVLNRFVEKYKKNRRKFFQEAVDYASEGIQKLQGDAG
jgi:hypothetical protein